MANENKTLREVFYGNSEGLREGSTTGTSNQPGGLMSFNVFLSIYSINLTHRFPDVTALETIPYETIIQIAEFSAACSNVALDVWKSVVQTTDDSHRGQMSSKQKRAA